MRVALVGDEYPPVTGGAAVYAKELALHLSRLGVEVVVYTREGAEEGEVEVRRLRGFGLLNRSLSPRLFAELRRELRSGGFSVVHGTDMYSPLSLAALRFAKGAGLPSVITCHSVHRSSGLWRAVHLPLTLLLRRADRVIAVSEASRGFCVCLGVPEEKVRVVPNGVDPSLFHEGVDGLWFRRRLGVGDGGKLVVAAMRLVRRKGPYLLLEAFSELAEEFPGLRLAVAGEGPEEEGMKRRVRERGLEGKVEFLGPLPHEEVAALMAGADLFVLPSFVEACPLAAMEAMAVGTPVVCPRAGGMLEFGKDGYNCLMFRPGDPSSLREAMARVLSDGGLARALRRGGLRTARRFTWERTARLTLRVYEEIA